MKKEKEQLTQETIRKRLLEQAEPKYQEFHSKLLPGVDNVLGVRVPALRKLAKEIVRGDWETFLKENDREWYEKDLLQGLVIGQARMDYDQRLVLIKEFLPRINNWAVCDVFCSSLKDTLRHREEMWEFLQACLDSREEYAIRFALVMMLDYFAEPSYLAPSFAIFDAVECDAYYVRMALAWAVSVYFVKFPEETFVYLKDNRLDDWTYNKALQKITESYRVDAETKKQIRAMKRK